MTKNHSITQRKQDHIDFLLSDPLIERNQRDFDLIQLTHRALPELDFASVNSKLSLFSKTLDFPLLISSMTGGAAENLGQINRHLAEAAEHCQVALAVGSQRAMIEDTSARRSFDLRQYAPSIPLLANIGAVQLNTGYGFEQARIAIDCLQADALILHLNPLQELIQPEGDRNFAGLADKIHQLSQKLDIPIILKEVGCGLSSADIELGLSAGIRYFDLAGRGGTSWSRIEAHRAESDLGLVFQDWGLTTCQALNAARPYQDQARFFASGGIRNGIDMVKSVIMGGYVCGIAAPLLRPAMLSSSAVIDKIQHLKQEFQLAQFLVGAANIESLFLNDALILRAPSGRQVYS
ncbi:type 2 isopentenyl-diphosphate Delta-isomerase [Thiomicrospira microaerophila]|uniref:type 2 isopentenyl-diphosphate Delta-isomerase n=1 Tax=Thiomicrospira microaerophila TaxID=406020 RepID=UPI00200F9169|nr:type 2 isopentenyl-diphosphate Delta-isomerase [Thiomicrospira microaerophila]UQB42824.1 type 2 isopentenyl-diphosphate Delta-isomerase [Thiomicrospira microaerophila]